MYYSLFEIFSVGVGPSSSHTVGPMRAAKRFVDNIRQSGHFQDTAQIDVTLFGSLALTGVGHGTVKAIIYGLMCLDADEINPEVPYINAIERDKILHLGQEKPIQFDIQQNVVFKTDVFLPEHSNALKFQAKDINGNIILEEVYFSVGGGTIARQDEMARRTERQPFNVPYQFDTFKQLYDLCVKHQLTISELVLRNEEELKLKEEVYQGIFKIHRFMQETIDRGMKAEGILPGSLKIKRRAADIYKNLKQKFQNNDVDPLMIIDWINLWGFAVAEENAAGGRIVTAPTMGSSGVIPSVMRYFQRFSSVKSPYSVDEGIVIFLTTASAICSLYRTNASISGAEVGCQGEVGVACSMAAAGLAAAMGGNLKQIENAAEIAMEHNLGLTCDPIAGLVQVPCIERNAMGAVKAVNAARIAMKGSGEHFVSLDSVIKTMYDTGRDMNRNYKETSLGGLAVNVPTC